MSLNWIKVPTLLLLGEKDEYVPDSIDKRAMMARWAEAITGECESHLIPGAGHYMGGEEAEADAVVLLMIQWLDRVKVSAAPIARRASVP